VAAAPAPVVGATLRLTGAKPGPSSNVGPIVGVGLAVGIVPAGLPAVVGIRLAVGTGAPVGAPAVARTRQTRVTVEASATHRRRQ
jgi:hypothetical protein